MKHSIRAGLSLLIGGTAFLQAADISVPRIIDSNTTWTADNTYFLEGYTFVVTPEGASEKTTLTIEPGTVIKGRESTGANAASLVITRGAMIHAAGTAMDPIIFTSELDDLNGNLTHEDTQLWGGLVILGNASINSRADSQIVAAPVQDQIEGIETSGSEVGYSTFGGTDDEDNSGVIRYVSIRHGGAVIGGDNEINGLTMGGVGRGTTIEFVEVFANKDDAFEWFGGTVNARYLVAAYGNDDSFDYDQGWRGKGQFWFTIGTDIGSDRMDKAGEHDGATAPLDAAPFGDTTVYNATYIGIGGSGQGGANTAFNIRDHASARYYNSIFVNFEKMMDIENDNEVRFNAGDVDFRSNVWWSHVSANNNAAGFNARPSGTVDPTIFWTDASRNNLIQDPQLGGISYSNDGGLNPLPTAGSPALSIDLYPYPEGDSFYQHVGFAGAFQPDYNWMANWTKLHRDGYLEVGETWINHPQLGWIYTYGDGLRDNSWIWMMRLNTWAFYYTNPGGYAILGIL